MTTFKPGETITVSLRETIDHPSHYRIAFNPEGDDFEDPTGPDDKQGEHPYILLDDITDTGDARQDVQVTLPDITCDHCTLQLIQVMLDKQGNGFGGNDGPGGHTDNDDIYYACADLVLSDEPAPAGQGAEGGEEPVRPASAESDGGCTLALRDQAHGARGLAGSMLALAGLALVRRRSTRRVRTR